MGWVNIKEAQPKTYNMKYNCFFLISVFISLVSCKKDGQDVQQTPPQITQASIKTGTPFNLVLDSATITCSIVKNSDTLPIIESGICYATSSNPDTTKSRIIKTVQNGDFVCQLFNLDAKTKYYARAYYRNKLRTVYGNEIVFTSEWHPTVLGNTYFNGAINTLCTDPSGNVYAGGAFTRPGGYHTDWYYVAKWNKTNWAELTDLKSDWHITTLCANTTGDIYASARTSSEWYMSKYTSSSWNKVGAYDGGNFFIRKSCVDKFGNLYVIGDKVNFATGKYYIAKWSVNTNTYSELGSFDDFPLTLCTDSKGTLYVAGLMNHGRGWAHWYVAKWDGTTWSELGDFNSVISCISIDASGNLLAAGAFYNSSGYYYVAKWDGQNWSELGKSDVYRVWPEYNDIRVLHTDNFGNVYIASRDLTTKHAVRKWDGTKWSVLASFNKPIYTICTDLQGNVYAGGEFTDYTGKYYVAKCNQ